MKTILALLIGLGSLTLAYAPPTTNAPSVVLAWDAVTDPSVNGYNIYWGTNSRVYFASTNVVGRLTTTVVVTNLLRGLTYYFAATSVATNGLESDYSAEVSYTTIPLPPIPTGLGVLPHRP